MASTDDDKREAAIKRLREKRAFRTHVFTYLAVNAMLTGIWAISGGGFFWPIFSIVFWGFGLAMHGWTAYGEKPISEDEIRREMERGGDA